MRFPEFKGEWEKCYIDKICSISTGNKNTQDKEENGLYPFYVRSATIERINSYTFDGEAVLTAGDGVGVGKVFHYSKGKIGVHQRVYIMSDFQCNAKYFYFYFSDRFYDRVKHMSAKNSVDSVRKEMIARMIISLPSKIEQEKIANILTAIDERISTQSKIIGELKRLKSAIIENCYSTNISSSLSDLLIQQSKRNKNRIQLPIMSVNNKLGFIAQSEQFENREVASEDTSNYKIVSKGMFAYNPSRINIGSFALYRDSNKGIVSPMYICFTTKSLLNSAYLKHYFTSNRFKHEMHKRLEGSVRLCLTFESLCNIHVPLLPIEEQNTISSNINKIVEKIVIEDKILTRLKRQKQYLLHQMFI